MSLADLFVRIGRDLKATQCVIVHEPVQNFAGPQSESKSGAVMCCCCIPRGTVHMDATFDTLHLYPGQRVNVKLNVHNDSGMSVDRVKTKLKRTITLRVPNGQSMQFTTSLSSLSNSLTFHALISPPPLFR